MYAHDERAVFDHIIIVLLMDFVLADRDGFDDEELMQRCSRSKVMNVWIPSYRLVRDTVHLSTCSLLLSVGQPSNFGKKIFPD